MSHIFSSGGQSIGASASVLPMNIQDCFPLGLTGLISLLSKGLSRVFSSIDSSVLSLLYGPTLTSIGEGNGNPLQYSCLENAKDRGAWWAAVYRATQSWTRLRRRSSSRNSHLSMTTRKSIALTVWTFVGKAMSLLFNTLSRFVIGFLPRSKHLLISWLQSSSTVILEPKIIKSATVSIFICHEVMGPDAMILVFEC